MPGIISPTEASPLFTIALNARLDELKKIKVNNFFRAWFPDMLINTRYPVIDIRRATEQIAIDAVRGSSGQRIQFTKYDQKAYDPFYFFLWHDLMESETFLRAFGSNSITENVLEDAAAEAATRMKAMTDMIERAVELMCAQCLEFGTITSYRDGSVINYKRQAGSFIDLGTGNYWTDATDPYAQMVAAGDWLRQQAKYAGYTINAVMGLSAWQAFRKNAIVSDRLKQFNNNKDVLNPTVFGANGGKYQGDINIDNYVIRVWTTNDVLDNPSGSGSVPYMNPKKVFFLPEDPSFKTFYGAIPQVNENNSTNNLVVGKYVYKTKADSWENYIKHAVESCPLPAMLNPDEAVTMRVVA